jgi:hypothetical protein
MPHIQEIHRGNELRDICASGKWRVVGQAVNLIWRAVGQAVNGEQ